MSLSHGWSSKLGFQVLILIPGFEGLSPHSCLDSRFDGFFPRSLLSGLANTPGQSHHLNLHLQTRIHLSFLSLSLDHRFPSPLSLSTSSQSILAPSPSYDPSRDFIPEPQPK